MGGVLAMPPAGSPLPFADGGRALAPGTPAYTVVLLAHVAAALVGLGSVVASGVVGVLARRGPRAPSAGAVRRYFRPGPVVAGRVLYAVPVLGFALVGMSRGAFSAGDGFVVAGLGLWAAAMLGAEAVLWPAERRVRRAVDAGWVPSAALDRDLRHVVRAAASVGACVAAAMIVMIVKP